MPKLAIETATGASKVVHDDYEALPGEILKEVEVATPVASEPEPQPEPEPTFEPLPVDSEEGDED